MGWDELGFTHVSIGVWCGVIYAVGCERERARFREVGRIEGFEFGEDF